VTLYKVASRPCESNSSGIGDDKKGSLGLLEIGPVHVAAWVESLEHGFSPPTVKQWLATVRMLFDWLVVGQVLAVNPTAAVRGPKYVVRTGKTPVLAAPEARQLLDSVNTKTVVGLRDRALIGLLVFTFARIWRCAGHERGRCLPAAPPSVGQAPRKRWQGTQHALPP
jgi:site-specific recombinase XerD